MNSNTLKKELTMFKYFMHLVFGFLLTTSVYAQGFGAATLKLSAIYEQLKIEYEGIMSQLEEAKAANSTMNEIYNVSGDIYDEYRFIEDFSTEAQIRMITNDIGGLTGLTGLSETDNEGKFKILRAEISRRFKDDSATEQELLGQISELERLEALKQAKLEEAAAAGAGSMNDKNLNSSIASSNALITAMQISEQQKAIREAMRHNQLANDAKAHEDGFIEFLNAQ
ncbi:MAG: hypothetical protein GY820_43480 [Gammaproteobacteria bacterium]|nr:hypothetical protein [Gammaproteobacteria bacterium]